MNRKQKQQKHRDLNKERLMVMKLGKKLLSVLMTMVMVFALFVPAAAAEKTDIEITNGAVDSVYSAWRILDAEQVGSGEDVTYKYNITNEHYRNALKDIMDDEDASDSEIITYISKLEAGEAVQEFADALYAKVKAMTADETSENSVFEAVDQGYYLIAETTKGSADHDTVSKVMLKTKGEVRIEVATKEGTVTLEKKVGEEVGTDGAINLQDGADYDFGDAVPFQLKGTLPDNYSGYKTYYYEFVDHLSTGLELIQNSIHIYVTAEDVEDIADATNKTEVTDKFTLDVIPKNDGTVFSLNCENLKTAVPELKKDHKIFVSYKATLTESATTGKVGNQNKAYVKFSNSPYVGGYGRTVEDIVIVFTYEYDVNKVDGAGEELKGAGFTLYKQVGEDWEAVGSEIKGEDITRFEFKGLDQGTYKLVETTVPANYNKADDKVFTITASYDVESSDPKFQSLHIDSVLDSDGDGKVEVDVVNLTGMELPDTGGIGTTIFYAAGGILVVGAAIMLIAKKRTESEE